MAKQKNKIFSNKNLSMMGGRKQIIDTHPNGIILTNPHDQIILEMTSGCVNHELASKSPNTSPSMETQYAEPSPIINHFNQITLEIEGNHPKVYDPVQRITYLDDIVPSHKETDISSAPLFYNSIEPSTVPIVEQSCGIDCMGKSKFCVIL